MKTAKKMGIKTVAVYSDADENSMHVDMVSCFLYKMILLYICCGSNYFFLVENVLNQFYFYFLLSWIHFHNKNQRKQSQMVSKIFKPKLKI